MAENNLRYFFVREITPEIEAGIHALGVLCFNETQFQGSVEYAGDKLVPWARSYIKNPDRVMLVAFDGDRMVGVFMGLNSPYYFSADTIARDVLWYVHKDYRSKGVGMELLGMFESWAKDRGAKLVRIEQDSAILTPRFTSILEKRGYKFIGTVHNMKVE
jgi:GNAT superfamily N-acetyltransferase